MKKIVLLSMVISVMCVSLVFADGQNQAQIDAMTGPGVGLVENNTNTSRIYGYGSLITGINGAGIVEANANEIAPTSVESNIINPINNFAIDMGPTSNYYAGNYSEHSINDGGPGMGVTTNVYGNPVTYGGGPGIGLTTVTNDGAPSVINQIITPEEYVKMYNMTPKEASTEIIYGKKKPDAN